MWLRVDFHPVHLQLPGSETSKRNHELSCYLVGDGRAVSSCNWVRSSVTEELSDTKEDGKWLSLITAIYDQQEAGE